MIRRPPRSTPKPSSAASDVYKRQNRPLHLWQRRWFQSTELAVTPIGERPVLLFVDTFSRYFEPENLRSAQRVLTAAGFTPFAPLPDQRSRKPLCCGRTHLSVGNVARARDTAQRIVEAYAPYAAADIPIVGLEPSCLLALKDEIPALLNLSLIHISEPTRPY